MWAGILPKRLPGSAEIDAPGCWSASDWGFQSPAIDFFLNIYIYFFFLWLLGFEESISSLESRGRLS